MLAKFGGHPAIFADSRVYFAEFCAYDTVLHWAFTTSFPFLILLVMYHIAHIDMVIFHICVLSYSPLLLQYGPQNLGGKEINNPLRWGAHGDSSRYIEGVGEINI